MSRGASGAPFSRANGFAGGIEATPVTGKYKLGLVLAAISMVLLMAVYFGLILALGYGVYFHLAHFSQIASAAADSHSSTTMGGSLLLPVGGLVVLFFLFKPFLAGRPPEPDRYTLTQQSDPELFALIGTICQMVNAPLPSRVDVDCRANASVHFRKGWRSMKENDVVLTIGLPLVANLTMQEFVGVLAHEFGHFRQGAGMRLTYVIRAMNQWFATVVYARDDWDVRLMRLARYDIRLGMIIYLTRFTIWLSRRVLWLLMQIGHVTSGFMLRQMEFDADSYEIKVAGSAAFAQTMGKIQALDAASLWAHAKIKESWQSRRLPEDLVRFISASVSKVPPEVQEKIDAARAKQEKGLFATHPSGAARISAATALNQPGVFHRSEPAMGLINGFAELCKSATRFYYEGNLELRVRNEHLVANDTSERESQSVEEGESALRKFFCGARLKYRPVPISGTELALATDGELIERVQQARQGMEQSAAEAIKANREYEEAEALYQRGLNALKNASQTATERAEGVMGELTATLGAFEGHAHSRLTADLRLLNRAEFAKRLTEIEALRSEADRLTPVFDELSEVFATLQELRRKTEALRAALKGRREPGLATEAQSRITQLEPELREILKNLQARLSRVPYPFHHSGMDMTLEEYAQSDPSADLQMGALYNNGARHVNRLLALYERLLGRFCFIALKVEGVFLQQGNEVQSAKAETTSS